MNSEHFLLISLTKLGRPNSWKINSVIFSISKDDMITNVLFGIVLSLGFLLQYLNFNNDNSFYISAYYVSSLAM